MSSVILVGKKKICTFCERSWPTIHSWIRNMDFPARKLDGVWESDAELIIKWRRDILQGNEFDTKEITS